MFTPIWVWKFLVVLGATVGTYVWWQYPHFRSVDKYIEESDYPEMLVSVALVCSSYLISLVNRYNDP